MSHLACRDSGLMNHFCKMTLQMETLLLPFLTPGDLFIPAHHPDQGPAAKEAGKESIKGWKMKRST